MNISIDYDATYTRDPELFLQFIKLLRLRDHRVYCVTMRTPSEGLDMDPALLSSVHEVIFTSRKAKKEFCANLGLHIDVWVDDTPFFILKDAAS